MGKFWTATCQNVVDGSKIKFNQIYDCVETLYGYKKKTTPLIVYHIMDIEIK